MFKVLALNFHVHKIGEAVRKGNEKSGRNNR